MMKKAIAIVIAISITISQGGLVYAENVYSEGAESETVTEQVDESVKNMNDIDEEEETIKADSDEDYNESEISLEIEDDIQNESIEEEQLIDVVDQEGKEEINKEWIDDSSSDLLQVDSEDENAISTFAGNSISTATSISIGKRYSGKFVSSNNPGYYKFTINSSGRITLTATAEMSRIYYDIYDKDGNKIWFRYCTWDSTTKLISTHEKVDLIKGTYYLVVRQVTSDDRGNYSFNLSFNSANESFTDTGRDNYINSANHININTKYNGQIAVNDDTDCYKIDLSSSGRINLSATCQFSNVYYYIYNKAGESLCMYYSSWDRTTELGIVNEKVDLTKGTYYFVVKRANDSTGNYSFNLHYTNANESFTETDGGNNNTIATANNISLNVSYTGQIAANDKKDFYKFTLNSSNKVYFNSTANLRWTYYYIYDQDGKELWRGYSGWNDLTEKSNLAETIDLNAGTYYLAVEGGSYCTGVYSFKLATHVHKYSNVIVKATTTRNGKITKRCSCGAVNGTGTTIYYPKSISLSATTYTYDGKIKKPTVTVKGSNGGVISPSNYTVVYSSGRKNVGTYRGIVKFKGNYSGNATKTFKIIPKTTSISQIIAESKGFTVKWKKQTDQVTGYKVQYSLNKNFSSNCVTRTVTKNSIISTKFKNLKAKKKYYVRVRTYKKVGGTEYYSNWSAVKTVTTKK